MAQILTVLAVLGIGVYLLRRVSGRLFDRSGIEITLRLDRSSVRFVSLRSMRSRSWTSLNPLGSVRGLSGGERAESTSKGAREGGAGASAPGEGVRSRRMPVVVVTTMASQLAARAQPARASVGQFQPR